MSKERFFQGALTAAALAGAIAASSAEARPQADANRNRGERNPFLVYNANADMTYLGQEMKSFKVVRENGSYVKPNNIKTFKYGMDNTEVTVTIPAPVPERTSTGGTTTAQGAYVFEYGGIDGKDGQPNLNKLDFVSVQTDVYTGSPYDFDGEEQLTSLSFSKDEIPGEESIDVQGDYLVSKGDKGGEEMISATTDPAPIADSPLYHEMLLTDLREYQMTYQMAWLMRVATAHEPIPLMPVAFDPTPGSTPFLVK